MRKSKSGTTGTNLRNTKQGEVCASTSNTEDASERFRSRRWSITVNNYTESDLELLAQWKINNFKCVAGLEDGKECNTPHVQGYIEFPNPRTFKGLKREFPNQWHFEPSYKNRQANINYCTKECNVFVNSWEYEIYAGDDLPKSSQLYDWQKDLIEKINNKPDPRCIYWYYEPHGNSGKSTFGKYLAFHYNNVCLTTATKSADILTCVDTQYNCYVLDFPRTLGSDFAPFTAIEQLKNGFITDSKLKKQSRMIMFNPPHVIIFSNYFPKVEKLSRDRWRIFNIYTKVWEM